MVAVIAAVGGKIERDRDALLPGGEALAVKALDSSAVEKPAYWRMVHGRPAYMVARGPRVNGARPGSEDGVEGAVFGGVEGLDVDAFGRGAGRGGGAEFAGGEEMPVGEFGHVRLAGLKGGGKFGAKRPSLYCRTSPPRGGDRCFAAFASSCTGAGKRESRAQPISPLAGEMSDRTERGASLRAFPPDPITQTPKSHHPPPANPPPSPAPPSPRTSAPPSAHSPSSSPRRWPASAPAAPRRQRSPQWR